MARKQVNSALDDATEPDWPTQKKKLLADGRAIGINNSVWLYRGIDMAPVDSAKTVEEGLLAAKPILDAFAEISKLTQIAVSRRSLAKSRYRDVHLLLVNIPEYFNPSGKMYEEHLRRLFPNVNVQRRMLLFGVRLNPSLRSGGWREAMDSIVDTFDTGTLDVNLNEYARDYGQVDAALTRAGLYTPDAEEFRIADSWWNSGRFPDTPYLVHPDHLHMFLGSDALADAERLHRERVDCRDQAWLRLPRHHTLSMVAYSDLGKEFTEVGSVDTHWCSELLSMGAAAVSIRGKVEPGKLTHSQIRAGRKTQTNDLLEAERDGTTLNRADQEEKAQMLANMEQSYSSPDAPVTLIEASIIAALSGSDSQGGFDVTGKSSRIVLANMANRQERAFAEMMMCSQVRANPNLKDLPAPMVAYSGLPSLSIVGDSDGALLGFTEYDRQPAYVSSNVASATDSMPLMCVVGQTGSGKLAALSTRVPTPTGWTTIGDIEVGDEVLGRNGLATKVSALSPITENPQMYRVTLSDGQVLKVDFNHQFIVSDSRDRRRRSIPALNHWLEERTMVERLRLYGQRNADSSEPISVEDLRTELMREFGGDLPWPSVESMRASLDMMFVDGQSDIPRNDALFALANRLGERLYNPPTGPTMERRMTVGEMLHSQRHHFIQATKPISLPAAELPEAPYAYASAYARGERGEGEMDLAYLRGSFTQRFDLLNALMDTCGRVDGQRYAIDAPHADFATSALSLLRSLGIVAVSDRHDEGGETIRFRCSWSVLSDRARQPEREMWTARDQWIRIVSIEECEPEPARCISVEDPDHTYLLEDFIPQSNTQALLWLAYSWAQPTERHPRGIPQIIVDPKLLRLDTPVPTPTGWSTIRDIEIGDQVLSRTGQPCTVIDKSKVYAPEEISMCRVRFDDGQELYADLAHQFVVSEEHSRSQKVATSERDARCLRTLADQVDGDLYASAEEIVDRLHRAKIERFTHSSEISDALQRFTVPADEADAIWHVKTAMERLASQLDEEVARGCRSLESRTVENIRHLMRDGKKFVIPTASVEGRHHDDLPGGSDAYAFGLSLARGLNDSIPTEYEIASRDQRLELVRGIMDACGRIDDHTGRLSFSMSNHRLLRAVIRVMRSLGIKVTRENSDLALLDTNEKVFRHSSIQPPEASPFAQWLRIVDITVVEAEAGQCLSVDSPDHTYLAGDYVVTHNTSSDHAPMVESVGGRVMSLDEISQADGALDPLRFAASGQAGVDAAVSILLQVNPWGPEAEKWEADLTVALGYGVEKGARCIGRALELAVEARLAQPAMVEPIFGLADRMALFRACVGRDDSVPGLRVSEGITLIKAGNANLDLPNPGAPPVGLTQRICVALVRMMVFGSAMALSGRSGVLHFDEAWVAMSGGAQEVQRLGRLARSQDVLPILYTQRVSDLVNNDMTNYISRGLILAIADLDEARAACLLFNLEPTEKRLARIRAKDNKASTERTRSGAPNYNSLRALFIPDPDNPGKRKNIRGSVALYCDIQGRVAPTEIRLPEEFLFMTSTTPDDVRRRDEFLAQRRVEEARKRAESTLEGLDIRPDEDDRMPLSNSPSPVDSPPLGGVGAEEPFVPETNVGATRIEPDAKSLEDIF